MGVLDGVVKQTGGYEAGGVRHIHHEDGADFIGETAHAGVVPLAAVGTGAADDEARTLATRDLLHVVVVDTAGFGVDIIFEGVEDEAREVDGAAVAEVSAVAEVHAHKLVAGLQTGHKDGHVGLGARVGLHVGVFGAEKLFDTGAGKLLHLVDYLTAAVVAVAGIALGVLVGEA